MKQLHLGEHGIQHTIAKYPMTTGQIGQDRINVIAKDHVTLSDGQPAR